VQNYESKLSVMEEDKGRSAIVSWIASFDSQTDHVTNFYRIGLDSLARLLSSTLTCSNIGNYFNKTLSIIKDRPNLSIYWR
jgi:hypothetical protein